MPRGRKGDSPEVKTKKAGRFRKPDARQRRKKPAMSVEQRAEMIAALTDGQILNPPSFMLEGRDFDLALQVWKELAPDLDRLNALARPDRYTFAMYCVHMGDWIDAVRELNANGPTYIARNTVNGDELQKLSPWVKVRELAEKNILKIGERFGLDPSNRFKMIRDEALIAGQRNLFERVGAPPAPDNEMGSPTGFLARTATPPPRPN
jgi:P27 family predicted phage terminase small subunit